MDCINHPCEVTLAQGVVHREANQAFSGVLGNRALPEESSETLTNGREVKWLVMEHAGNLPLLHVGYESRSLINVTKSEVVHMPDVFATLWDVWFQYSMCVSPIAQRRVISVPNPNPAGVYIGGAL